MAPHRGKLILLPPNRVWRTYPGGRTLDELAGVAEPRDSHLAEDWIASTTRATNPGRTEPREGISQVCVGRDPQPRDFAQLLASDPEYFLGAAHVARHGVNPMLLVKFLDSGVRLHFQVHPTKTFAHQFLHSPSGKTEAYHILGTRPEIAAPYIYVGFQHPPTPTELKRLILAQDIAGLEACFDKIPVQPGDTFIIPGGTPHALGAGVFMVEIQEPTDLVVRYEFEKAGYVLPEAARFMGRDVDFALQVFDYTPTPLAEVDRRFRCRPHRVRELGPGSWQDELIGPEQTDCFRVALTRLAGPVAPREATCAINIVTAGALTITAGGESHHLKRYDKFFLPAGLAEIQFAPDGHAEILQCYPPDSGAPSPL